MFVMLTNADQCEPSPESHWDLNASPECGPILNVSPECDPVLNKVHIRDAHECRDVCTLSVRMDQSIHSLRSIDSGSVNDQMEGPELAGRAHSNDCW